MTTTAQSLVDWVRDLADDYGDATTVLAAQVSTADEITFSLESADGFSKGDWINVGYETCLITGDIPASLPYDVTVRRGQRGSTPTTHSQGAFVISNPRYPNHRILNALNAALGKFSKTVRDTSTLTVVDDQYVYEVPSGIEVPKRVEIENSLENDESFIIRNWEMVDSSHFRIFGSYPDTRNIMVVGVSKFSPLTAGGDLDADFPDADQNAINCLIYEALGQLLLSRHAKIAGRDSFEGLTDAFAQTQPDHSVRVALQYLAQAERYRRWAIAKCPVLQAPVAPTQNPTRSYLSRV